MTFQLQAGRKTCQQLAIVVDRKEGETEEVDIRVVEGPPPEEEREKVTVPPEPPADEADEADEPEEA